MRGVRIALLVGVRVVLAVVGDPVEHRALHRHRAEHGEGVLEPVRLWKERCVSSRWKPTVMPKPVSTYLTARTTRSVASTGSFQKQDDRGEERGGRDEDTPTG